MDVLSALEAEGRAARRSARPVVVREKRQRGRIQKRRGYAAEKLVERVLAPLGFARVPLSGQIGGSRYSGDLRREEAGALRIVEVKRRAGGQRTWRTWLAQGGADLLVIVPGHGEEPLAVLELGTLARVLGEAGYDACNRAAASVP